MTVVNPTSTSVVLPLTHAGSISGRVVTADGTPVVDGWVYAQGGRARLDDAHTSRDGSFRLYPSSPGTYQLTANDSDHKTEVALDVRFDGNDVAGVVLTLPARAQLLRGTVVDAAGVPVADARVEAFREYDPTAAEEYARYSRSMSETLTSQDGRFTLDRLRDARYRVVATASNGTARGELNGVALGTTPRIALQPLGTLEVRVMLDGAPLSPYQLRCKSDWRVSTSRDGVYRFVYLPPGTYECDVDAAAGSVTRTVEIAAGVTKLELALERRGAISGTFVDIVTGEPVSGVFVIAIEPQVVNRARAGRIQPTDAAGRFLVPTAPGTRELIVDSTRDSPYLLERTVTVEPGKTVELGIVEGIPPGPKGSIGVDGPFENEGVRITRVDAGKPGDVAGILVGDVITAINNRPVARLREVWWQAFGAGKTYRLTLSRGVTVNVTAVAW